jgi:hypothetical protein
MNGRKHKLTAAKKTYVPHEMFATMIGVTITTRKLMLQLTTFANAAALDRIRSGLISACSSSAQYSISLLGWIIPHRATEP